MPSEEESREYVLAPWGDDDCDTEIIAVDLPSREITVQLETPVHVLERTTELSEEHDISLEVALAERLEINMARVSLLAARATENVNQVQRHLAEARDYLAGVETLDTTAVDEQIEAVWMAALDTQ